MAPKKLLHDPPPAMEEDSDDETFDEEEEDEEVDDAAEAGDGKAKSTDDDGDDDEEEEELEEDKDEEDEEKKEKPSAKKTQSPSASEEDAGSGSETESENTNHSPSASDFTVKPIVSKPMKDAVKPSEKNPPAKPSSSVAAAKSGSKRPAETEPNPKDSKKKKVASGGDDGDAKKGRLWSEDDEIAILKGMLEFQSKKGQPITHANMPAFHEFIKKNLQADVTTSQLSEKIRRLKTKYTKKGDNGEDPVFSKPHESKSLDLSKKIWGEANGVDDSTKGSKRKPRKNDPNKVSNATVLSLPVSDVGEKKEELNVPNGGVKADPDEFWAKYPCLSGSLRSDGCALGSDLRRLTIQRMPLISGSKVKDLEEKWRTLQLMEMELAAKKLDLMQEQAKLVLNSMKSSKD